MSAVLYDVEAPIATLTLNRPDKLNALSPDLLDALDEALDRARDDDAVRVLILKGAGRAFSAGHDISPGNRTPTEHDISYDHDRLQRTNARLLRLFDLPKPVIAQVHGYCIAVGTVLPTFCDLTVVADNAVIRWPMLPIGGGMIAPLWTYFIGAKKAKEMSFIAGSEMSGADAHFWGWANYAVPESELEATTRRLALQIAKTPPDLLRIKKLAINRVLEQQGFRTTVASGGTWDALAHFTSGVGSVRSKIRELGIKGAIQWFHGSR